MVQELAATIDADTNQLQSNESTPDRSLLQRAKEVLAEQLKREGLTAEGVHLGSVLYNLSGDWDACIELLARYLEQPLSTDEEAWARWSLTDFLAMQRRHAEAVRSHKEFLAWARRTLPTDRLLWVMFDETQALSWIQLGLQDEWLQIFTDVMASVAPGAENRLDRFYYLRTAGELLINFGHDDGKLHGGKIRADDALQIAVRIRDLAGEDPLWDRAFDIMVQSHVLELDVYLVQQDIEQVRRLEIETTAALDDRLRGLSTMTGAEKERLRVLYDNAAYPLYRARQYDLAIPLFRRSIDLGSPSPHARTWLAASLWATTGDRHEVLGLLKEAAHRWYSPKPLREFMRGLPEFQDVVDDADFERAAAIPGRGLGEGSPRET